MHSANIKRRRSFRAYIPNTAGTVDVPTPAVTAPPCFSLTPSRLELQRLLNVAASAQKSRLDSTKNDKERQGEDQQDPAQGSRHTVPMSHASCLMPHASCARKEEERQKRRGPCVFVSCRRIVHYRRLKLS